MNLYTVISTNSVDTFNKVYDGLLSIEQVGENPFPTHIAANSMEAVIKMLPKSDYYEISEIKCIMTDIRLMKEGE